MKKTFLFILILFISCFNIAKASPIEMDFPDGRYHFVLSGDKIK